MRIFQNIYHTCADFLTMRPASKYQNANRIWLAVLFVSGLIVWGFFLNWGGGPVTFHDWAEITGPRFAVLRNAITTGSIPLNSSVPMSMGETSSTRIMAIPDLLLSPQILLLPFMSVTQFALFQILLLYSVGFWGLLRLRKKLNWSILTFSFVFALFNFNGHITDHLAVGHITWGGYFLFSWFALLIFDVFDHKPGWQWVAKMALLMFAILLQGSYHQFIWLLFFLGFFAITQIKYFWPAIEAAFFSVLISLVRLLPELSLLNDYHNKFISGYPYLDSIFRAMINIDYPANRMIDGATKMTGTWETSIYIGLVGMIFLIIFGVLKPLTSSHKRYEYTLLLLPIAGMIILSMDKVYKALRIALPYPPLTGERVVTRMMSVAFVFLLFLAAIEFQRWIERKNTSPIALIVTTALGLCGLVELSNNFTQWRVISTARYYPFIAYLDSEWIISNNFNDTVYLSLIAVGFAFTLFTAIFLAVMSWREARAKQSWVRLPLSTEVLRAGGTTQPAISPEPVFSMRSNASNLFSLKWFSKRFR